MERFKLVSKNRLEMLPKTAGVYLLASPKPKGVGGFNVVYIGKAVNIRSRVKNHFNQPSYKDNLFIDKVNKIGYLETGSEIEALILEASLIKKHQPKFNIVWRDDKNYFYVALRSAQGKPYIFITHQKNNHKTQYIGPFVEGTALKKTLRFLRRVFPYYTTLKHSKTNCTYCHLGLCPGPRLFEARLASPKGEAANLIADYKKNIKKLILILRGKRGAVLNSLRKEMRNLSKERNFEEAAKIRDKIYSLQQVMSHTRVIENATTPLAANIGSTLSKIIGTEKPIIRIECYDVSNIQGKSATGSMVVFTNGKADKSQYKKFKIRTKNTPDDIAMLKETLERRFSHPEWQIPEVILIDGGIAQLNVAIKTKNKTNPEVKVISIAKRNKELFIEGRKKPVLLKTLPREIYNLIINLDDEAHRFAITYHKKLRKKTLLT